jgi:hypothetical protein
MGLQSSTRTISSVHRCGKISKGVLRYIALFEENLLANGFNERRETMMKFIIFLILLFSSLDLNAATYIVITENTRIYEEANEKSKAYPIKKFDLFMASDLEGEFFKIDLFNQYGTGFHNLDRWERGFIKKSKTKVFEDLQSANDYMAPLIEQDKKSQAVATKKKEEDKKAELARRQQECNESGSIIHINNWSWGRESDEIIVANGLITNASANKLDYIKVLVLFYDQYSNFISSASSFTKITTIMPYQSSPFKVYWPGANPLARSATLKILDRNDNEIKSCSLK